MQGLDVRRTLRVVSQGLALALLAWLQTLPEFAVEAVIAWHRDVPLMTANFTGSLRLLTGVAWPLIYFVAVGTARKRGIKDYRVILLEREHAIGIIWLLPPLLYFFVIWAKSTLTIVDTIVLPTEVDLRLVRLAAALLGIACLLYAFIWEAE